MRSLRSVVSRASAASVLSIAIASSALVTAAPREARAADRWTSPYAGVRHLHRRVGPFDYHLVRVDLRDPRVRIVGTDEAALAPREGAKHPGHRWMTVSSFARETHADIAINANYYDIFARRFSTCGLTMTRGRAWSSSYDDHRLECDDSIGFGADNRAQVFDSRGMLEGTAAPFAWMDTVVTGSPRLLRDGEPVAATFPRHALSRNPRTAIGLSQDRSTLFLLVVNGREGRAQGMTCLEAARVLREHGAWNAVNLDGGGSSALYIRRERGVVSHFADGAERAVGNHLGIVFDESAAPHTRGKTTEVEDPAIAKARPTQDWLNEAIALRRLAPAAEGERGVLFPSIERPRARAPRPPASRGSWLAFGLSSVTVGLVTAVRKRRASTSG